MRIYIWFEKKSYIQELFWVVFCHGEKFSSIGSNIFFSWISSSINNNRSHCYAQLLFFYFGRRKFIVTELTISKENSVKFSFVLFFVRFVVLFLTLVLCSNVHTNIWKIDIRIPSHTTAISNSLNLYQINHYSRTKTRNFFQL